MTGRDLTLLGQLRIHPVTSLTGYALGPRRFHEDWLVDYFGSPRNTHLPWSSTQGLMTPTLWRVQCFPSPRLGPCPSWRLTTNDHTRSSAMICFLGNPTAPFAEEPCRATSEYLAGGPTAGPGLSSDGSRNRVRLFPSGTGRQPTHGVFLNSFTRIR